jgi:hypothetical protein
MDDGRFKADPQKKAREARRRVLEQGLLACYEIIDRIRKELAELQPKEPTNG